MTQTLRDGMDRLESLAKTNSVTGNRRSTAHSAFSTNESASALRSHRPKHSENAARLLATAEQMAIGLDQHATQILGIANLEE
jgi:hypothetical protein